MLAWRGRACGETWPAGCGGAGGGGGAADGEARSMGHAPNIFHSEIKKQNAIFHLGNSTSGGPVAADTPRSGPSVSRGLLPSGLSRRRAAAPGRVTVDLPASRSACTAPSSHHTRYPSSLSILVVPYIFFPLSLSLFSF